MSSFIEQLDTYVPERLSALNLPGVALGLIAPDGTTSYRCYGYADLASQTPVEPTTVFQIASISKAVSAWGIMTLVEQGKLDLDAPVERYLSRWQFPPSPFDSSKVTARLLLMHFAGTSLSGCGGTPYDATWYSVDDVLYGRTPGLDERQTAYAEKWDMDPGQYGVPVHLFCDPGERFAYSGGGFCILELLIEEITGQAFTDYMRERVLAPLGMVDSTFEIDQALSPRVATPYDDACAPMPLYRTNGKAAGGMYSSIIDLCRFAAAEMPAADSRPAGGGVLRAASVEEMQHPARFAEHEMGLDFHTGLGHYVVDIGGVRAVQHTGGNPGWRSVYTVIPALGAGFACLVNSAGGNDLWMDLIQRWSESVLG